MCRMDEADTRQLNNGCLFGGFCCNNLIAEIHNFVSAKQEKVDEIYEHDHKLDLPDVVTEAAIDQYITLLVANDYGACHDF